MSPLVVTSPVRSFIGAAALLLVTLHGSEPMRNDYDLESNGFRPSDTSICSHHLNVASDIGSQCTTHPNSSTSSSSNSRANSFTSLSLFPQNGSNPASPYVTEISLSGRDVQSVNDAQHKPPYSAEGQEKKDTPQVNSYGDWLKLCRQNSDAKNCKIHPQSSGTNDSQRLFNTELSGVAVPDTPQSIQSMKFDQELTDNTDASGPDTANDGWSDLLATKPSYKEVLMRPPPKIATDASQIPARSAEKPRNRRNSGSRQFRKKSSPSDGRKTKAERMKSASVSGSTVEDDGPFDLQESALDGIRVARGNTKQRRRKSRQASAPRPPAVKGDPVVQSDVDGARTDAVPRGNSSPSRHSFAFGTDKVTLTGKKQRSVETDLSDNKHFATVEAVSEQNKGGGTASEVAAAGTRISDVPPPQSIMSPVAHPVSKDAAMVMRFEDWSLLFRMPQAYQIENRSTFPYSRCENTDATFLNQLMEFRRSIKSGGKSQQPDSFRDYVPNVNFVEQEQSARGSSAAIDSPFPVDPDALVSSRPGKLFDFPPTSSWIPVQCKHLGLTFRDVRLITKLDSTRPGQNRVYEVRVVGNEQQDRYIRKQYMSLEKFNSELAFFTYAHSPYIIKPCCVDYGSAVGDGRGASTPSIIMEHVGGGDLYNMAYWLGVDIQKTHGNVESGWYELTRLLAMIFAKVMVGIRHMHALGFIHTDIKPENVLYDPSSGYVKIIDFDTAVQAPYVCEVRGTSTTVAPEMVGLLKGPVHWGVDWWGYGSMVAMVAARAYAGLLHGDLPAERLDYLKKYVPFNFDFDCETQGYKMSPLPVEISISLRQFLYPFFSPMPASRNFSTSDAYRWVRTLSLFKSLDWTMCENPQLGDYFARTPMQQNLYADYRRPTVFRPGKFRFMRVLKRGFKTITSLYWSLLGAAPQSSTDDSVEEDDGEENGSNEENGSGDEHDTDEYEELTRHYPLEDRDTKQNGADDDFSRKRRVPKWLMNT